MKSKKNILIISGNLLLLLCICLCVIRFHSYANVLLSQKVSKFWAGDSEERFSQVSCFFSSNSSVDEYAVMSFRNTINKNLTDAGVELKTEGEYWSDAYSAIGKVNVEGNRGPFETTAIGVGGNFFMFHPYHLRSGSYIYDSDIMKDRVILDYELAWKLFGSVELEGMSVKINGKPYYIAGVIEKENDKFTKKAAKDETVIFMAYSTLSELNENTSITCYEITMPDPISNFGKKVVTEGFSSYNPVVVENSSRYSFKGIYPIFKDFGSRSIIDNEIAYPYWENAARISEIYIARLYVIIALLSIVPLVFLVILLVRLLRYISKKIKLLKFKIWDAWDDRYARQAKRKKRKEQKRLSKTLKEDCEETCEQNRNPFFKLSEAFQKLKNGANIRRGKDPKINKKLMHTKKKKGKIKTNSTKIKSDNEDIIDEKEISLDIESIVREVLSEKNRF